MIAISWLQTFQPNSTPFAPQSIWSLPIDLGPVVEFRHVNVGGQIATAQAYPVGTGNVVSDKVEWIMEHVEGPFRFGIMGSQGSRRLVLQLGLIADHAALTERFPGGAA